MLSLYEILKASKTGIAPDMWTALAGKNWNGTDTGHEVKELTGIPPLSFTADGTPLLDYLISGNMSQSGTPSPTTPIQPQETGDMSDNILTAYKENYSINASGEETYNNVAMIYKAEVAVTGSTFTLNFGGLLAGDTVRIHSYTGNTWQEQVNAINIEQVPYSFTVGSNIDNIRISIRNTATDVTMTDGQYKIPISSANTTTPVYLGEVETTRRIKKYECTGQENWYKSNTYTGSFYAYLSGVLPNAMPNQFPFCSHLGRDSGTYSYGNCRIDYNALSLWVFDTDTSVTDFKSYLAQQYANGTPVTIWYVLATPTTGIVNEPLRKIGDYADTLSMEQAGVQIPTNRGNTVIDVETELKPSEMYIKYQE